MKVLIALGIVIIVVLFTLAYYIDTKRNLEYDLYKCEQDWSKEYQELKIKLRILEFKYGNLEYECNQGSSFKG